MASTFRVEVHDGKAWSFGIRMNYNTRKPKFCSLMFADQFTSRAEAFKLRDQAARLAGGSLRVAMVRDHD